MTDQQLKDRYREFRWRLERERKYCEDDLSYDDAALHAAFWEEWQRRGQQLSLDLYGSDRE